eukprot:1986753-Alexandrium_andersonii.AAC.1
MAAAGNDGGTCAPAGCLPCRRRNAAEATWTGKQRATAHPTPFLHSRQVGRRPPPPPHLSEGRGLSTQ